MSRRSNNTIKKIMQDERQYLGLMPQQRMPQHHQMRTQVEEEGGFIPLLVAGAAALARIAGPAIVGAIVGSATKKATKKVFGEGVTLKHKSGRDPTLYEQLQFLDAYINKM